MKNSKKRYLSSKIIRLSKIEDSQIKNLPEEQFVKICDGLDEIESELQNFQKPNKKVTLFKNWYRQPYRQQSAADKSYKTTTVDSESLQFYSFKKLQKLDIEEQKLKFTPSGSLQGGVVVKIPETQSMNSLQASLIKVNSVIRPQSSKQFPTFLYYGCDKKQYNSYLKSQRKPDGEKLSDYFGELDEVTPKTNTKKYKNLEKVREQILNISCPEKLMIDLNDEPSLTQKPEEPLKVFHDKLVKSEQEIIDLKERMLMQETEDLMIPEGDEDFIKKYKYYCMGNYKGQLPNFKEEGSPQIQVTRTSNNVLETATDSEFVSNLQRNALQQQISKKIGRKIESDYPRVFKCENKIPDWLKKQLNSKSKQQVIDQINIRDVLEKETPENKNRSPFDRIRLINFVEKVLSKFLFPNNETKPLFKELVENIVDERLHLKTYGTGAQFLREGDRLDSFYVVLEGHVTQRKSDGTVIIHRPNDIIGEEHISKINLSMHQCIQLKSIFLDSNFYAAPRPIQRTDILSIYFDEVVLLYQRIIDIESRKQLALIGKINWFSLLDPLKAQALKNNFERVFYPQGSIIYDIGQKSDHFYLLQSGKIRRDTMFVIEQIRKNPQDCENTNWQLLNQKVLRTVEFSQPPCIFGHIDIMANQRPRIIKAVAETDIVVLKGEARLLFQYLHKDQLKTLSASTQASNPYDIGQIYINKKYDERHHNQLFLDSIGLNPYKKGHKVQPFKERFKYPTEQQKKDLKTFSKSMKIEKNYGHQFPAQYFTQYHPDYYQQLPKREKMQVWHEAVAHKAAAKIANMDTGMVLSHSIKQTLTPANFLIKKDITRDPYVIVNPIK